MVQRHTGTDVRSMPSSSHMHPDTSSSCMHAALHGMLLAGDLGCCGEFQLRGQVPPLTMLVTGPGFLPCQQTYNSRLSNPTFLMNQTSRILEFLKKY